MRNIEVTHTDSSLITTLAYGCTLDDRIINGSQRTNKLAILSPLSLSLASTSLYLVSSFHSMIKYTTTSKQTQTHDHLLSRWWSREKRKKRKNFSNVVSLSLSLNTQSIVKHSSMEARNKRTIQSKREATEKYTQNKETEREKNSH